MKRLTVCCLALVAGVAALALEPAQPHSAAWVAERVQQWQPTAKDRSWENIGWAKSLTDALQLGKEHRRPIFLFTHDGHLNVGRC